MSSNLNLRIPLTEEALLQDAQVGESGWDHPHCTGFAEDSQSLILESIEESLPPASLKVLFINPGPGRLQERLIQSVPSDDLEVDCLHEWFQDAHLSSVNSQGRWSNQAFTWTCFLNISEKYDLVIVKISKSAQMNEFTLKKLTSLLDPTGKVWFWGANDEGMKSIAKKAQKLGFQSEVLLLKKSCRVAELNWTQTAPLHVDFSEVISEQKWSSHSLKSVTGCFGHGKVDQGSELFMETLKIEIPEILNRLTPSQNLSSNTHSLTLRVLDLGCGSGVLSHFLEKELPIGVKLEIVARDAHSLAIESLNQNLAQSEYIRPNWGYMAENIDSRSEKPFDIVISNPPFHLSKKTLSHLGKLWLNSLEKVVNTQGVVYLVANSFLDYSDMGQEYFKSVDLLQQRSGFCTYKMIL